MRTLAILGIIMLLGSIFATACGAIGVERLEPGYAAVKIDYTSGSRTSIPAGGFLTFNPVTERIAKYPINQESLVMVRRANEGKVSGDDSVEVRSTGVPVHIDTTVFWRVNPEKIGDLFQLRTNVPLIGKDLTDNLGIDGAVVRRLTRGIMQDEGASYTYDEIQTGKRAEFEERVAKRLAEELTTEFLIFDRLQLGEVYLEPDQQAQMTANQAQKVAAETARLSVETEKQKALAAIETAKIAAADIRAKGDAEASSIKAREEALAASPHVMEYDVAMEQARHLPQVLGSGSTPFLQLPSTPRP